MKFSSVVVKTAVSDAFDEAGAIYSHSKNYRYALWRFWGHGKRMMYIGLNPSTATHLKLDPTITRCVTNARKWGYGGMFMLNLFAFRATDPREMRIQLEPNGAQNNRFLLEYASECDLIIAAWGNHGTHLNRAREVLALFKRRKIRLMCLGTNANGTPKHPLYLPGDTIPSPFPVIPC